MHLADPTAADRLHPLKSWSLRKTRGGSLADKRRIAAVLLASLALVDVINEQVSARFTTRQKQHGRKGAEDPQDSSQPLHELSHQRDLLEERRSGIDFLERFEHGRRSDRDSSRHAGLVPRRRACLAGRSRRSYLDRSEGI